MDSDDTKLLTWETSVGKEAFEKLCKAGCKPDVLMGHLEWLKEQTTLESEHKSPSVPQSLPVGEREALLEELKRNEVVDASRIRALRARGLSWAKIAPGPGREVSFKTHLTIPHHPLDSWKTAFGGLTRRQVQERIPALAMKLRAYVAQLRKAPVVDYLIATHRIGTRDLLSQSPFPLLRERPSEEADPFRGLLALSRIAMQVGQRKHPDINHHLTGLFRYVYRSTRRPHDREVAKILADLFPDNPHLPRDQEAVKNRRRELGVPKKKRLSRPQR